jgi:hypothetical protein
MTPTDDEAPPTDPLALIKQEQANLARSLTPNPLLMLWPWGFAWLLGFGLFFLRYGPDGRVFVDLPEWLPLIALTALIFAAGAVTGVAGAHSSRQLAGPSTRQSLMYGLTWALGFSGLAVVFTQLNGVLPEDRLGLLWAGGMVALTGALHMAGGTIWNDRNLFFLGAWTSVVNVIGVLAGPGWQSLILAIAGGGGMIVAGLVSWSRLR